MPLFNQEDQDSGFNPGATNQYSTGDMNAPENTNWMKPDFSQDSTLSSSPQGSEWAKPDATLERNQGQNIDPVGAPLEGNTIIPLADGTAVGQVQQGWTMPTGGYQNTAGWEISKLNDPNKHDPKYDWLRAVQSTGGNQNLNAAVDYYNQNFGANNGMARWLGSDKVDFGGGVGPVDVLFDQEGARKDLWAPIWGDSTFNGPGGAPGGMSQGMPTSNGMGYNAMGLGGDQAAQMAEMKRLMTLMNQRQFQSRQNQRLQQKEQRQY